MEENVFGNSGGAEEPSRRRREAGGEEELIMSQTLKSVFEVQEAIFSVCGVGRGWWVAELGISLVALRLAHPGEFDFSCMIDNDIVTRSHVERSKAIDEELCKNQRKQNDSVK